MHIPHSIMVKNKNTQNKNKIKKQPIEFEAARSAINNLDAENRQVMEHARMLAFPSEGAVIHAPTLFPCVGASRRFTRTFTLSATAANQEFGLKLKPSVHDFYSAYVGVSAVTFTGTEMRAYIESANDDSSAFLDVYDMTGTTVQGRYESNLPKTEDGFRFNWASTNTGFLAQATISSLLTGKVGTFSIVVHHTGGSTTVYGTVFPEGSNVGLTSGVNVITGISVSATVPFRLILVDVNATGMNLNSLTRPLVADSWMERGQVSRSRISAMSVLCSYRGNLLENAGVISGVRAPDGLKLDGANLYSSLTKIPDKQYHGPLIKGIYGFWLPNDQEELDFADDHLKSPGTCLYIGGIFTDAGAALEVTLDVVLDLYSPLQIFERLPYPPLCDQTIRMLHELEKLPAFTCNPSHLEILGKGLKQASKAVVKGVKGTYDFVKANPQYVEMLMTGLSLLA